MKQLKLNTRGIENPFELRKVFRKQAIANEWSAEEITHVLEYYENSTRKSLIQDVLKRVIN